MSGMGWRIHQEGTELCASMWVEGQGDVITVKGFISRHEVCQFIASYLVLMTVAQKDKAVQMLQDFVSRVKPS